MRLLTNCFSHVCPFGLFRSRLQSAQLDSRFMKYILWKVSKLYLWYRCFVKRTSIAISIRFRPVLDSVLRLSTSIWILYSMVNIHYQKIDILTYSCFIVAMSVFILLSRASTSLRRAANEARMAAESFRCRNDTSAFDSDRAARKRYASYKMYL